MVTAYGMSEKLGSIAFESGHDEVFIGKTMGQTRSYSEKTAAEIDDEVKAIIDRAYARCEEILTARREVLTAVAEYLLAHETGVANHLTDHIVRKLAHFCEYALEGFLLTLCLRVYTRHFFVHISWPILGGLLTALTDETIQMFSDGRSSQLTDVWLDLSGAMAGILVGLFCLALCRMCWLLYKHRNED